MECLFELLLAPLEWLFDLLPERIAKVILAIGLFIGLVFLGPFLVFFLMPLILYWLIWGGKPEEKEEGGSE